MEAYYKVLKVRIQNSNSNGERLGDTEVSINGEVCGRVQSSTTAS